MWRKFRAKRLPYLDSLLNERTRILAERKAGGVVTERKSVLTPDGKVRTETLSAQDLDHFRISIVALPWANRARQIQREAIELELKESAGVNFIKRQSLERELKSGSLQPKPVPVGTASGVDSPLTADFAESIRPALEEHVQSRTRYLLNAVHEYGRCDAMRCDAMRCDVVRLDVSIRS